MRSTLFNMSSPFCKEVSFFLATAVIMVTFPVVVVVVDAEFWKGKKENHRGLDKVGILWISVGHSSKYMYI